MTKFVSTIPMKPGGVNPSYRLVETLADQSDKFQDIAKQIVVLARKEFGKTNLNPAEMSEFRSLVNERLAAAKQQWMDMVRTTLDVPPAPQVMPSPPPAKELYGRVADGTEIVDVGSGNCLRLVADSGRLKITAIDPVVGDVPVTIKKLARPVEVADIEGQIVTSHNAVCQIPPGVIRDAITRNDGLHLVPDHPELISQGCAMAIGDRIAVHAPNTVFLDHPVIEPGYVVAAGYKLMPTYQRRCIYFEAPEDPAVWESGEYTPKIDCSPCGPGDIDWSDMGWKWDGVPLELEITGGKGWITRRDGAHVEANVSGDLTDMSLHVEWLVDQKILVLLRVEFYRGMIPPHCGSLLRHFCDRISVTWGGCVMVAPPEFDLARGPMLGGVRCPVDGIITRVKQRDFYVKPYWTVDLRPADIVAVANRVRDAGKKLVADVREGLWEYRVLRKEEVFELEPVRPRVDKSQSTTIGTVDYLFGLPTLTELVAVTGLAPEVQGLACYFVEM